MWEMKVRIRTHWEKHAYPHAINALFTKPCFPLKTRLRIEITVGWWHVGMTKSWNHVEDDNVLSVVLAGFTCCLNSCWETDKEEENKIFQPWVAQIWHRRHMTWYVTRQDRTRHDIRLTNFPADVSLPWTLTI